MLFPVLFLGRRKATLVDRLSVLQMYDLLSYEYIRITIMNENIQKLMRRGEIFHNLAPSDSI